MLATFPDMDRKTVFKLPSNRFDDILEKLEDHQISEEVEAALENHVIHAVFKHRNEGKRTIVREICVQQVFIISSMLKSVELALALPTMKDNPVYRDFFENYRSSLLAGKTELSLALKALKAGSFETVMETKEMSPKCMTFAAAFNWLVLTQAPAHIALCMHLNFKIWGHMCRRILQALEEDPGFDREDLRFFKTFAGSTGSGFHDSVREVYEENRSAFLTNRSYEECLNALHLLQYAELEFWDGVVPKKTKALFL